MQSLSLSYVCNSSDGKPWLRESKSSRKSLQRNITGLFCCYLITMCCSKNDLFNSEIGQQPSSMAEDDDFFNITNPTAV